MRLRIYAVVTDHARAPAGPALDASVSDPPLQASSKTHRVAQAGVALKRSPDIFNPVFARLLGPAAS